MQLKVDANYDFIAERKDENILLYNSKIPNRLIQIQKVLTCKKKKNRNIIEYVDKKTGT